MVSNKETKIYFERSVSADSLFFKVFDYEFTHGNAASALNQPNGAVLTEDAAKKLFGDENAMGKIINWDNRRDYIVRGIVKEPKGHAHFKFDVFIADNNVQPIWLSNNWMTYVKIKEGVEFAPFLSKMQTVFLKKIEPDVERFLKITVEEFFKQGNAFEYELMPIEEIHLHSQKDIEIEQNGDIMYIYVFIGIAFSSNYYCRNQFYEFINCSFWKESERSRCS